MTSVTASERKILETRAANLKLPANFTLGAATAAYQIEGAPMAGGKSESIWDRFCRKPGAIIDKSSGDVACDHYHRWPEDVALMRQLRLDAYRFSLAWTRIQPGGSGPGSPEGIAFYDRLIDGLLEAGIKPFVTLYHWDLPQSLQDRGGWYSRETAQRLADYADIATRAFGDRVKNWATLNEPWTFCWSGHATGEDAPGLIDGVRGGITASHHALLGHGLSVPVIRRNVPDAKVSIVLDLNVAEPASDAPGDVAAARRFDGAQNRWYLDAVFRGSYPADMLELFGPSLPEIKPEDGKTIAAPIDSLGINLYRRSVIADGDELPPLNYSRVSPPGDYSAVGYEIYPQCIYDVLHYVHENYAPREVFISENGLALANEMVNEDGEILDHKRAHYYVDHIEQLTRAAADGVPVTGYFAWTLMDNFEWAYGYTTPFGLIHVDFESQERRVKLSGHIYAAISAHR
jgi:beta-glucosidase